jgi:uncharacterized protein (PEP-CTERM system associated)
MLCFKKNGLRLLCLSTAALSPFSLGFAQESQISQGQPNQERQKLREGERGQDKVLAVSLSIKEIYTDNVNLDSVIREGDFITEVTPNVSLRTLGPKFNAQINYGYQFFYYPQATGKKTEGSHNLLANVATELVDEVFFVNGFASIQNQYIDRRNAISSLVASRTENRQSVQNYSISPYVQHNFGNFARMRVSYDLNYLKYSLPGQAVSREATRHNFGTNLSSGRKFTKFRWSLNATHSFEDVNFISTFGGKRRTKNSIARLSTDYQLNRFFSLLGSVGYQKRVSGSRFADYIGVIWDIGVRATPGPRTSLSVRYGKQNGQGTYTAEFHYQISAVSNLRVSYIDELTTFQDLGFRQNQNTNTNIPFTPRPSTLLYDGFTQHKSVNVNLDTKRGRTTFYVAGNYTTYTSEDLTRDEKRFFVIAGLSRQLTRKMSFTLSGKVDRVHYLTDDVIDVIWNGNVAFNYSLSKKMTASLQYTYSKRSGAIDSRFNGGTNYVALGIKTTF